MTIESLPIAGLYWRRDARAIHLWSDEPLAVVSSAVVGAELEQTRHIVNMHVARGYDCKDPAADLHALARALNIENTFSIAEPFVGMMTGVPMERVQVVVERNADATVAAIVTVGVSHPVAAGITEAHRAPAGTINIILLADAGLSRAARVNAIITATEAKTLALLEADLRAPHGERASGTGTDAMVVASTERGASFEYAGPISPLGALMARAMRRAVQQGLAARWAR